MVREIETNMDGGGLRIAIVLARFNVVIGERLLEGALRTLISNNVEDSAIDVARVPGAFELPNIANQLARLGKHDAIICLGAVVRGETPHFDFVAGEAARGISQAAIDTGVPIVFGVLTTDDMDQAMKRSGGLHGNKGKDCANAAVEMANLRRRLEDL